MSAIYDILADSELTSLRVARRGQRLELTMARSWDPDLDFARYGQDFHHDAPPNRQPLVLGDAQARRKLGPAMEALAQLEVALRAGGHEQLRLELHPKLDMRVTTYIHSSTLGRNNGLHGLRAGGLRRHERQTAELEVLQDGLNLSRAMTFKNAAAGIPFGGCKLTAQCDAFDPRSAEAVERLGFLAWVIDSGALITGPDMGFSPEMIDALQARFTRHILCGPGGRLGHTGAPTARGVFKALFAAAQHRWGPSGPLKGRRVLVQGLGSVGLPLAQMCAAEGARLLVADTSARALAAARDVLPEHEVIDSERVLDTECDVLSPCAYGALFDAERIARLSCQLIYGGANNQLVARSQAEELKLATLIAERGILTQPDWTYTSGGVLLGTEEYVNAAGPSLERVHARIDQVCGDGTRTLLERAEREAKTPTEVAYRQVEELLAGS